MKIAVVGLGYVGLPLSLQFARSCVSVLGIDVDPKKIDLVNNGRSYIKHIEHSAIAELVGSGKFSASTDFSLVKEVEAVIICVPTPLTKNREPDISFVLETGRAIAPFLPKGALVVLESTTYPGTTDEDLRVVLEEGSGMKAGLDFHLAFSPEREDPANEQSKVKKIPKVVGGYTPACLERATKLYGRAIDTLVPVLQNPLFGLPAPATLADRRTENASAPALNTDIAPFVLPVSTPSRAHTFTTRIDLKFNELHNGQILLQIGRLNNLRQFGGGNRLAQTLQD